MGTRLFHTVVFETCGPAGGVHSVARITWKCLLHELASSHRGLSILQGVFSPHKEKPCIYVAHPCHPSLVAVMQLVLHYTYRRGSYTNQPLQLVQVDALNVFMAEMQALGIFQDTPGGKNEAAFYSFTCPCFRMSEFSKK